MMAISELEFNLQSLNADVLDQSCEREIKIIVMGQANAGKSSMIQIFFGKLSPKTILEIDIEPTIGAEINVFEYDEKTKIGVFDLAGQELDQWMKPPRSEELFFETDGILYFIDLTDMSSKRNLDKTLKEFKQLTEKYSPKAQVIIVLNKYDDYIKTKKGSLKKANAIKMDIQNISGFPTYISSLAPNYYPLLQMKLDRIIEKMPVEIPSFGIEPIQNSHMQNITNIHEEGSHIIPTLKLADTRYIPQDEYNERISRSEILHSEFSIR